MSFDILPGQCGQDLQPATTLFPFGRIFTKLTKKLIISTKNIFIETIFIYLRQIRVCLDLNEIKSLFLKISRS